VGFDRNGKLTLSQGVARKKDFHSLTAKVMRARSTPTIAKRCKGQRFLRHSARI
jgi:hypothetical protein